MNRNFPSCIGEDAFEWVGDRNKTPHSLPDVTSSNTRYTCEDFPATPPPRWRAEFALQGARMRIARAYLVAGQAEPAPRDPRGGGFDPGDAAAFAAASAPAFPGVPQGQSGFASRGG